MSKSIIDDPRTTAYILGELNAAESAKVEAALAADPDAQFLLDDLQATADLLSSALAAEPMPELRTPQRDVILSEPPVSTRSRLKLWRIVIPLAAVLALTGLLWQSLSRSSAQVAFANETTPAGSPSVSQAIGDKLAMAEALRDASDEELLAEGNLITAPDDVGGDGLNAEIAALKEKLGGKAPNSSYAIDFSTSAPSSRPVSAAADNLAVTDVGSAPSLVPQVGGVYENDNLRTIGKATDSNASVISIQADNDNPVALDATITSTLASSVAIAEHKQTPTPVTVGRDDDAIAITPGPARPKKTVVASPPPALAPAIATAPVGNLTVTASATDGPSPVPVTPVGETTLLGAQAPREGVFIYTPSPVPSEEAVFAYASSPETSIEVVNVTTKDMNEVDSLTLTAHADPTPVEIQSTISRLERDKRSAEQAAKKAATDLARQHRELAEAQARLDAAKHAQASIQASPGAEQYAPLVDNPFKSVDAEDTSTFSVDVDTAAYANMRRFLRQGQLPPPASVRIEELINYFNYDYPQPADDHPFAAAVEVAQCPWNLDNRLLRVGLSGKIVDAKNRPASNLVFLVDVSGSMSSQKKLPLLQKALKVLVSQLDERDSVGIVTYAGASGVALPSTTANNQETINHAIDKMRSGGSTNGASGIMRAYQMAQETFVKGGLNRVILATDGDFNVGITNRNDLTTLIEGKAKSGVFLSVLGFGMGNLNDHTLEQLADKGNGNYAYIDDFAEARKVLVDEMMGTLLTIAKDVKVQMVFNSDHVQDYRLIGYENRRLAKKDFDDDTKDAGEIGAGHTVTALYELVMRPAAEADRDAELVQLRLRYKQPDGQSSKLMEAPVYDNGGSYADASADFKFVASVASFGMLLRGSPYSGNASFEGIAELADEGRGPDVRGYRQEFLNLVQATREITRRIPLPPRQTARR